MEDGIEDEDRFVELQAILAGLPIHGVPQPQFSRSCGPELDFDSDRSASIRDKLKTVSEEYPDHQEVLSRLVVEKANMDMVCFVDNEEQRLFVSCRGTDRKPNPLTFPRDWSNNMRILVGLDPGRSTALMDEYMCVRSQFPGYRAYGSGHSLGGAVVQHLAKAVEERPDLALMRVDVFNPAVSPVTGSLAPLRSTMCHFHRVQYDFASCGASTSQPEEIELHTHPLKPHVRSRHALGHFLPEKAGEQIALRDEVRIERHKPERRAPLFGLINLLSCVGKRDKCPPPNALCQAVPATANALALPASSEPKP